MFTNDTGCSQTALPVITNIVYTAIKPYKTLLLYTIMLLYAPLNRFLQTIIIIIDFQTSSLRFFIRLDLAKNLLDIGIRRELVLQKESAYMSPNLNHQGQTHRQSIPNPRISTLILKCSTSRTRILREQK